MDCYGLVQQLIKSTKKDLNMQTKIRGAQLQRFKKFKSTSWLKYVVGVENTQNV